MEEDEGDAEGEDELRAHGVERTSIAPATEGPSSAPAPSRSSIGGTRSSSARSSAPSPAASINVIVRMTSFVVTWLDCDFWADLVTPGLQCRGSWDTLPGVLLFWLLGMYPYVLLLTLGARDLPRPGSRCGSSRSTDGTMLWWIQLTVLFHFLGIPCPPFLGLLQAPARNRVASASGSARSPGRESRSWSPWSPSGSSDALPGRGGPNVEPRASGRDRAPAGRLHAGRPQHPFRPAGGFRRAPSGLFPLDQGHDGPPTEVTVVLVDASTGRSTRSSTGLAPDSACVNSHRTPRPKCHPSPLPVGRGLLALRESSCTSVHNADRRVR